MQTFEDALNELHLLLNQPGTSRDAVDSALRLLQHLNKCIVIKVQRYPAPPADEGGMMFQPSNLFIRFVAAFRAGDWPQVFIIEHEAIAPIQSTALTESAFVYI